MQDRHNGYEALLRDIFQEYRAPIRSSIIEGDTEVSLQEALNRALDTLPFTRGRNDSVRWRRIKYMIALHYGLERNRNQVPFWVIAQELRVKTDSVQNSVGDYRRKLRKSCQWLEKFFVQTSAQ